MSAVIRLGKRYRAFGTRSERKSILARKTTRSQYSFPWLLLLASVAELRCMAMRTGKANAATEARLVDPDTAAPF
jgi:hypothetical protein